MLKIKNYIMEKCICQIQLLLLFLVSLQHQPLLLFLVPLQHQQPKQLLLVILLILLLPDYFYCSCNNIKQFYLHYFKFNSISRKIRPRNAES